MDFMKIAFLFKQLYNEMQPKYLNAKKKLMILQNIIYLRFLLKIENSFNIQLSL